MAPRTAIQALFAMTVLGTGAMDAGAIAPMAQLTNAAEASQRGPTRAQVLNEARQAMRSGGWRCMTNNRGWCGIVDTPGARMLQSAPAPVRPAVPGRVPRNAPARELGVCPGENLA